jgi:hypothetical protein
MNQRGMRAAAEKPYLVVYHDQTAHSARGTNSREQHAAQRVRVWILLAQHA